MVLKTNCCKELIKCGPGSGKRCSTKTDVAKLPEEHSSYLNDSRCPRAIEGGANQTLMLEQWSIQSGTYNNGSMDKEDIFEKCVVWC